MSELKGEHWSDDILTEDDDHDYTIDSETLLTLKSNIVDYIHDNRYVRKGSVIKRFSSFREEVVENVLSDLCEEGALEVVDRE